MERKFEVSVDKGARNEFIVSPEIVLPSTQGSLLKMTLDLFRVAAQGFAWELAQRPLATLFGATDGKAVGTKVESMFKDYLQERFDLTVGNAANGLDFPDLNLDLKVTSKRQP